MKAWSPLALGGLALLVFWTQALGFSLCRKGRGGLFAEDSYLNLLFSVSALVVHVNVDGEFVELVDQVLEVVGLDLVDVKGNSLLAQCFVHVLAGLRRNKPSEADSGAQQVHGHTDVYLDGTLMRIAATVGVDQDAQVFVSGGGSRLPGSCRLRSRALIEGGDQALGFVGRDLALREHLKNLAPMFVHDCS